jgi:hypothetical protein
MTPSYRVIKIREATDVEIATKIRLDQLAAQQLPGVRAAAQNWRNGVGFGTLATTVLGVLKTPDIVKVAPPQQVADGAWLLGMGILVAIAAFSCALRASFGWPAFAAIASEDDLRLWESKEVAATICYLRWSMALTVAALILLCASYAVLIFGIPIPFHLPTWR